MAQYASSAVLDGTLDKISSLSSVVFVNAAQHDTYASARTTMLASVNVSAGLFTKADYASGRQVTFASTTASVATTGTASHIHFGETGTSTTHFINTATSQVLTAGNSLTINGFAIKVSSPGQ